MKNLIELTITFPESETQTMILEKGSEAYKQMIDYAEINEGVTSECEKVLYNEKLMLWALRGILSTNRWEEIDILVDEYELVKQTLREDNIDAHESHGLDIDPTPSNSEVKDALFCNIDASTEEYRNQVWQAIMENINA